MLQSGQRLTAATMAQRLGVSERTVLRDLDVLSSSGVPVYAVRGVGGGFQLLDTFAHESPSMPTGFSTTTARLRRVRVRISPGALQRALLAGRPDGWRERLVAEPTAARPDWIEGSFRFDSYEAAVRELTALLPEVEVLLPVSVRDSMRVLAAEIAELHREA